MDREIDLINKPTRKASELYNKIAETRPDRSSLLKDAKEYCLLLLDLYKKEKINRISFCYYLCPLMWSGVKNISPYDEIGSEAGELEIPKHHISGDVDARMKNLIELVENLK